MIIIIKYVSPSISGALFYIDSLQLLPINILTCKGLVQQCRDCSLRQIIHTVPAGTQRWLSYACYTECVKVRFKVLPEEKEK